jgi:choline kinase
MPIPLTIVICCAGRGSRLGLGTTKALTEIHGRPLIAWQLDLLKAMPDVRIVVGYDAARLMDVALSLRRDVTFVFNHEYQTTNAAASLAAACVGLPAEGHVLSIDGDLLVHPRDLRRLIADEQSCLGVIDPISQDAVYALHDERTGLITTFTREFSDKTRWEWSGLFRLDVQRLNASISAGEHRGHIFEMLKRHLPLSCVQVDAAEIDTPEDYYRAKQWLSERLSAWASHG